MVSDSTEAFSKVQLKEQIQEYDICRSPSRQAWAAVVRIQFQHSVIHKDLQILRPDEQVSI